MSRRTATHPELQALTTTAISLATLAFTWTPGLATPVIAAVLTYLAVTTGGSWALRWHTPHTLAATNLILRHTIAATLRATAWAIRTIATALLWLLNTATQHLTNIRYTTAA
jgi:hypothetical protein